MELTESAPPVSLTAENVGGIERTSVEFDAGVTVLAGRNATHRTSFLQAIMAGLGSANASLKGDAEEGYVRLEIGDEVYTRELTRRGDAVAYGGDPYLDDPELADLFAFLLESNAARRTVALQGDLREILMQPVDAESIRSAIEERTTERADLEEEIAELEERRGELPALEERRDELEDEIAETRERLEAKRAELDSKTADADEAREEQSALEAKMAELRAAESDREQVEFQIESHRESVETLEAELADLKAQREELADGDDVDVEAIRSDLEDRRQRKQALGTELNRLQSVIQFNEEMLQGASEDITAALRGDDGRDGDVTDRLLDGEDTVACWTCGSEVERSSIEATLERLRELRQAKHGERSEIDDEIEALKQRRDEVESARRERERLESEIDRVSDEIDEREEKVATLRADREDLADEIDALEDEIEALEREDRSAVLEVHREVNRLEIELERLEDERDRVDDNVDEIESAVERIPDLKAEREDVQAEIDDLRTRIERIERDAVESFNDHMDTVLETLGYENLDRIWVERTEREVREGRRTVTESTFDLHVVRTDGEGVTYEDDFSHLSESEREVTGLIFALAGYLVHDVYEEVPFILLDSLEAIDSERIAGLVEYLEDYADYLVVALLVEDAAALDSSYQRVEDI